VTVAFTLFRLTSSVHAGMMDSDLAFRPLARDDFALLSAWLDAPHVKIWWREESDADSIEARYGPAVDGAGAGATEVFVIELDGESIGLIQRYRLDDNPDWRAALPVAETPDDAAGIDYLIGSQHLIGRGLGTAAIDRFVADTWGRYPAISAIVANVDEQNRRSWRALEKIGFHRAWTGPLVSDDSSDGRTSHVYILQRPAPGSEASRPGHRLHRG
jgi:aminoglycoside 6'-N-acetyltransferase